MSIFSNFDIGDYVKIRKGMSGKVYDTHSRMATKFNIYNWQQGDAPNYNVRYKIINILQAGCVYLVYIEDADRRGYIIDRVALEYDTSYTENFLGEELFLI